jgi:hypothetical protein
VAEAPVVLRLAELPGAELRVAELLAAAMPGVVRPAAEAPVAPRLAEPPAAAVVGEGPEAGAPRFRAKAAA